MYYEGDVEGVDEIVEEASKEILEAFLRVIDKRHKEIEEAFGKNEGRYTLSSLIAYCFAASFVKACRELNEGREDEERDAMKAWVREEIKARKGKKAR